MKKILIIILFFNSYFLPVFAYQININESDKYFFPDNRINILFTVERGPDEPDELKINCSIKFHNTVYHTAEYTLNFDNKNIITENISFNMPDINKPLNLQAVFKITGTNTEKQTEIPLHLITDIQKNNIFNILKSKKIGIIDDTGKLKNTLGLLEFDITHIESARELLLFDGDFVFIAENSLTPDYLPHLFDYLKTNKKNIFVLYQNNISNLSNEYNLKISYDTVNFSKAHNFISANSLFSNYNWLSYFEQQKDYYGITIFFPANISAFVKINDINNKTANIIFSIKHYDNFILWYQIPELSDFTANAYNSALFQEALQFFLRLNNSKPFNQPQIYFSDAQTRKQYEELFKFKIENDTLQNRQIYFMLENSNTFETDKYFKLLTDNIQKNGEIIIFFDEYDKPVKLMELLKNKYYNFIGKNDGSNKFLSELFAGLTAFEKKQFFENSDNPKLEILTLNFESSKLKIYFMPLLIKFDKLKNNDNLINIFNTFFSNAGIVIAPF